MPFTADDVGPRQTASGPVKLSLKEREAKAAEWNANAVAEAAREPEITLADLIAELEASDPSIRGKLRARADARK